MLTLGGHNRARFCDGLSRRDFLTAGALGVGGLTLADLLRLRARGAVRPERSHRSVIMVLLRGGPSHIDTYDPKPAAPVEIRGPFKPLRTNVPGVHYTELLPLQARLAGRLAVVRNMLFGKDAHSAAELMTGRHDGTGVRPPAFGTVVSRLSRRGDTLPPYVSLVEGITHNEAPEDPSYLGPAYQPFRLDAAGFRSLRLVSGVTPPLMAERRGLLTALDAVRRGVDDGRDADEFIRQAFDLISSDRARDAFDLNLESASVRERYGKDLQHLLRARRLVEAGVSVVTVHCSIPAAADRLALWDIHGAGAGTVAKAMPILAGLLDRGMHALLTDLRERGLERDVAVVVWGEFGRTPRINANGGRDHWPSAGFTLLAGGGLRTGQVVGATTARGERPAGRPYTPRDVLATLYHVLGIDALSTALPDHTGRPRYLLEDARLIEELV